MAAATEATAAVTAFSNRRHQKVFSAATPKSSFRTHAARAIGEVGGDSPRRVSKKAGSDPIHRVYPGRAALPRRESSPASRLPPSPRVGPPRRGTGAFAPKHRDGASRAVLPSGGFGRIRTTDRLRPDVRRVPGPGHRGRLDHTSGRGGRYARSCRQRERGPPGCVGAAARQGRAPVAWEVGKSGSLFTIESSTQHAACLTVAWTVRRMLPPLNRHVACVDNQVGVFVTGGISGKLSPNGPSRIGRPC